MKIRLLIDHPHSGLPWTAEPLYMRPSTSRVSEWDNPTFVKAHSEIEVSAAGQKYAQSFDLILCQGQFEIIEP